MYGSEENFARAYFYASNVVPGSSTMPNTLKRHKLCYECIISSSELLWTIFFVRSGLLPRGHHVFHHRLPPRLRRLLRRPLQLWRLFHERDAKLLLLRGDSRPSAAVHAAAGQRHIPRSRRLQRWENDLYIFFTKSLCKKIHFDVCVGCWENKIGCQLNSISSMSMVRLRFYYFCIILQGATARSTPTGWRTGRTQAGKKSKNNLVSTLFPQISKKEIVTFFFNFRTTKYKNVVKELEDARL